MLDLWPALLVTVFLSARFLSTCSLQHAFSAYSFFEVLVSHTLFLNTRFFTTRFLQ